jgi:H+/gluconate symporter-like permease
VQTATNVLAALTGSASGGLTIALDALGATYMGIAVERGIDPALMHRVAVIGAGTLKVMVLVISYPRTLAARCRRPNTA